MYFTQFKFLRFTVFFWTLICGTVLAQSSAFAQSGKGSLPAGVSRIEPAQPVQSKEKIEVIEFFSYGCPHCNDFHPMLGAWSKKLPAYVELRRVPVSFGRAAWANLSLLYYSLEATNQLDKFDGAVFSALHKERQNLFGKDKASKWLKEKGGDSKAFSAAFSSFGVQAKVKQADKIAANYHIQSVPSMAVNGQYMVYADKSFADMLHNVDMLIDKIHKSRKK